MKPRQTLIYTQIQAFRILNCFRWAFNFEICSCCFLYKILIIWFPFLLWHKVVNFIKGLEKISDSHIPLLICGDMNSLPRRLGYLNYWQILWSFYVNNIYKIIPAHAKEIEVFTLFSFQLNWINRFSSVDWHSQIPLTLWRKEKNVILRLLCAPFPFYFILDYSGDFAFNNFGELVEGFMSWR